MTKITKKVNKYVKENLSREIDNVILLNEILNNDFFYDEIVHFNLRGHEVVAVKYLK